MEKSYKAYVTLVLTKRFNIIVNKNVSLYFTITYRYEMSRYLP